jgi:hypothetical protein
MHRHSSPYQYLRSSNNIYIAMLLSHVAITTVLLSSNAKGYTQVDASRTCEDPKSSSISRCIRLPDVKKSTLITVYHYFLQCTFVTFYQTCRYHHLNCFRESTFGSGTTKAHPRHSLEQQCANFLKT